ncbi:DNA topoisomerase 6 subunit B [Lactuca sativa]|uniref:DNA topoisomerase 6 subunit B n=1 Tax=Lactuca sativa TaxID=4236 RepID=UPI0022B02CC6|nr:DNA topoisomerase 6 subunit B [Lactuca sativa]
MVNSVSFLLCLYNVSFYVIICIVGGKVLFLSLLHRFLTQSHSDLCYSSSPFCISIISFGFFGMSDRCKRGFAVVGSSSVELDVGSYSVGPIGSVVRRHRKSQRMQFVTLLLEYLDCGDCDCVCKFCGVYFWSNEKKIINHRYSIASVNNKKNENRICKKSLAEFFAENENIAGFDNPGKSLYSTVKELVENALDSAESIRELPLVEVTIEELNRSKFNSMIDDDFETLKDSEKRLRKKSALGKKVEEVATAKPSGYYRVTCKDNGKGMPHDAIPNMFGQVLFRKKYGVKQTRGKFGFGGAKMVSIWSKMSTGEPIEIYSSMKNENYATHCTLDVDIDRNIPHIHLHEKIGGNENWHGAEIKVVIEGNWTAYGSKILEYMRQMAVITPYAEFKFRFVAVTPDENGNGVVEKSYPRLTEEMPPVPVETKYHPSAVDSLHIIQRMIAQTKNHNLLEFLQHEFVNISNDQAQRLIAKMGPDVTSETQVNSLTLLQIAYMHHLFQHTKFDDPSGNCLAPLGDESFCEGIYKVLQPKMVATYTAKSAQVYQGHPFIVEAGVSLGGKYFKQGINIFRFANRVPLLFEQDADVVTTTAMKRIKWKRYKINKMQEKIGVFVNIISTKIPFKGTGMEYIGDDISEIAEAVKTCLEDCCNQLKSLIIKQNMDFYIDQAATACASITEIGRDLNGPDTKVWTKEELVRDFREDCKKAGLITD